jgi:ankyrin repeat protein
MKRHSTSCMGAGRARHHEACIQACRRGDLAAVTAALHLGVDLAAQGRYGWTALHSAAMYGHTRVVAFLLAQDIAVDVVDDVSRT